MKLPSHLCVHVPTKEDYIISYIHSIFFYLPCSFRTWVILSLYKHLSLLTLTSVFPFAITLISAQPYIPTNMSPRCLSYFLFAFDVFRNNTEAYVSTYPSIFDYVVNIIFRVFFVLKECVRILQCPSDCLIVLLRAQLAHHSLSLLKRHITLNIEFLRIKSY